VLLDEDLIKRETWGIIPRGEGRIKRVVTEKHPWMALVDEDRTEIVVMRPWNPPVDEDPIEIVSIENVIENIIVTRTIHNHPPQQPPRRPLDEIDEMDRIDTTIVITILMPWMFPTAVDRPYDPTTEPPRHPEDPVVLVESASMAGI